jgi:hypothetical protein
VYRRGPASDQPRTGFEKIPKVLETPKGNDLKEDVENLVALLALADGSD